MRLLSPPTGVVAVSSDRYVPSKTEQTSRPKTDCPLCGDGTKDVPVHIRTDCEVAKQIRREMSLPEGGVTARDDEEAW